MFFIGALLLDGNAGSGRAARATGGRLATGVGTVAGTADRAGGLRAATGGTSRIDSIACGP